MNIKEQIKQLEKIANQKPTYGCSPPEVDEYESKAIIAKQALDIIKNLQEVINALIEVNHGLAKVKSILEDKND